MNSKIKIIRAYWGDNINTKLEVPIIPLVNNQIVYVWGEDNEKFFKERGYETRLVTIQDPCKIDHTNYLIRKLIALDLALQEFDEVIFLDWDCYILRELDDNFYEYLNSKPIQCPLYAHCLDPYQCISEYYTSLEKNDIELKQQTSFYFKKYSWILDDMLIIPNFGCVYSRDKNLGKDLLNIALKNNLKGCVDEGAMFIYTNCSLEEYIEKYQPVFVQGVSDMVTRSKYYISSIQRKFNEYLKTKLDFDPYLEHE